MRPRARRGSSKSEVARVIYEQSEWLVGLARAIHADPEIAFSEYRASAHLVDLLSDSGFEIRTGVGALATAFVASRGTGELHLTFCAEYDALDGGIGHGSGRHLVAGAAVGTAIGLAPFADEGGLTVSVLGTPGAELLDLQDAPADHSRSGKAALLESGAFDEAHAVFMLVPMASFSGFGRSCARTRSRADLRKSGDHARKLDRRCLESELLHVAVQRGARSASCQFGATEDGAGTIGDISLSAATLPQVRRAAEAVRRSLLRAAARGGLALRMTEYEPLGELHQDGLLRRAFVSNAAALSLVPDRSAPHPVFSTDLGNVSVRLPAVAPMIAVGGTAATGTTEFAALSDTDAAYRAMLHGAVALAWTALDAATQHRLRSHLLDLGRARRGLRVVGRVHR